MENNFIIRDMNERDLDEILYIEKECFKSEAWSESSFRFSMEDKLHKAFVITENNDAAPFGYIMISFVLDEANIDNIAISPDKRRSGAGFLLINYAEDFLKDFASFISLEVRESNKPAIKLYEKCGYKAFYIRKNYYENPTENAIIMMKYFNKV